MFWFYMDIWSYKLEIIDILKVDCEFLELNILTPLLVLKCTWRSCLAKLSAASKYLHQGLSAYRQTVCTQIRLLLRKQSDLGPLFLLQRCLKENSRRHKQTILQMNYYIPILSFVSGRY